MYSIKETYYTIQGEGFHTGRPAVFLRFAGCNLWTGREVDRATAVCQFCDTDFFGVDGEGGGKFKTAEELAEHVSRVWGGDDSNRYVVCTGGEPVMQLDEPLIKAMHDRSFAVGIETNGTLELPDGLDWVCVSPKHGSHVIVRSGNELKVVVPQAGLSLEEMRSWSFEHFFVQPMDGTEVEANTAFAIAYAKQHSAWKVSLQTHKMAGIK